MVDLSSQPDREAMWYMEVAEAYSLFYLPFSVAASPPPPSWALLSSCFDTLLISCNCSKQLLNI
jgi:hypothetical protein